MQPKTKLMPKDRIPLWMRVESNPRLARRISDSDLVAAADGSLSTCDSVNVATASTAAVISVSVESHLGSQGPLDAGNLELLYPVDPCTHFSILREELVSCRLGSRLPIYRTSGTLIYKSTRLI